MAKMNHEQPDREYFYLDLSGPKFSPRKVEAQIGLTLHNKLERGAPCNHLPRQHPNHGKPSADGSAVLQAPENISEGRQLQWILQTIRKHSRTLRNLGATHITLWHVRFLPRNAQENFELSVSDMATLSRFKVPYCLSVYHLSKKGISTMPERYCEKPTRS